ncbi:MAG TPA: S41 family peptidase [Puia sp.]
MKRTLGFLMSFLLMWQLSFAQTKSKIYFSNKFSADTVKHTIYALTKELSLKQPGFYRYYSKDYFNRYIDSVISTVNDSLTEMETYLKIKPVISKISCLHTGISLPREYKDEQDKLPNLFPFNLCFINDKTYIVKNYSNVLAISPGDELITVNGRKMSDIVDQLFTLIPSDGYNTTLKYRMLDMQFPLWYRNIDPTENFSVLIKQNNAEKTCSIKGLKYAELSADGFLKEPVRTKQLEFAIINELAILTIHSFSKTDIKKTDQNFKKFIDQAFLELASKKIKNLIVDLRDNTGGSDPYAAYFTSYFFDAPFRYWDRIEVTEAIAKEIKGPTVRLFYNKPVQKDSVWLWQKGKHVDDFDFYETLQPAKNNFKGKSYVLINGFCMSSCADVAAVLSYHKKAVFIGQETGGGYQGNNSGMIPQTKVDPFGFELTVPLQKFYNYVDSTKDIGRGTMPDYPVNLTIQEILNGNDAEMKFVIDLIKNGGKN